MKDNLAWSLSKLEIMCGILEVNPLLLVFKLKFIMKNHDFDDDVFNGSLTDIVNIIAVAK